MRENLKCQLKTTNSCSWYQVQLRTWKDNHYRLSLLLCNNDIIVPNNYHISEQWAHYLANKWVRNTNGYAEKVPWKDLHQSDGKVWYIPLMVYTVYGIFILKRWLQGPIFQPRMDLNGWKTQAKMLSSLSSDDPEVKQDSNINTINIQEKSPTRKLIEYYSDWNSLQKAIAWILKLKRLYTGHQGHHWKKEDDKFWFAAE